MTEFTKDQVKWLNAVVVPKPSDPNAVVDPAAAKKLLAGFSSDQAKQAKREEKLDDINTRLAGMREALKDAQSFQVTWSEEDKGRFWGPSKRSPMNWSEANAKPGEDGKVRDSKGKSGAINKADRMIRDTEVDTKHDLVGGYQVDPEAARKALKMHMKIVALQTEMEEAVDASGKPLFTARDIERELWTPLVKADILPSNAVADKYSHEAQIFAGACEVYEERLKEYSKKASKHEKAQRALSIAGDFVVMAGSMAAASIRAAEFSGTSMSVEEKRELELLKDQDKKSPFPDGSADQLRLTALEDRSQSAKEAVLEQGAATLAAAFVSGVFDVASKSLNKQSDTKGWTIAEAAANAIASAAVAAVGVYGTNVNADMNATQGEKDQALGLTKTVQSLITYGLAGSKIVFRLREALDAPEDKRKDFIIAMITSLGDAVGSSFAAFDRPTITNDDGTKTPGTGGEWGKTGAYVSTAIIGAANITKILLVLKDAHDNDRDPDFKVLVASCGFHVIAGVMSGTYVVASDKVRNEAPIDVSGSNPFVETAKEKELREKGDVTALQNMAKTTQNMNALLKAFPGEVPSEKELAQKVAAEANARNAAKTKAELKSVAEEINKDPARKKELIDSIVEETDVKKAEIQKLIDLAAAVTSPVSDTAKNTKAKAAMDTLIAESELTKAKWAALDAITAGGVGLLVSFLPVAGLAAAIRQLVSDTAWLVKKSRELNLWQKNMALTLGNDSEYGPAIGSRLGNAEIQVSQKALNVVFSLVGVTAESMKLGDITGAATAVSVGNTMARALSDFGFKMQKEVEIAKGWALYKQARSSEGQGDRKLARQAMNWNSTLSKCVLAYGIVKDSDPIAAEVARNCGLSPELLADENDVCQRVVAYFMSVYSDDPVVMRRIPVKKDWHPAIPKLEFENWLKFKAAALTKAVPPLAEVSARTTAIDTALADIDTLWKGKGYAGQRDALTAALAQARTASGKAFLRTAQDGSETEADFRKRHPDMIKAVDALTTFFADAERYVGDAISALERYVPENGPCPEDVSNKWTEGAQHRDMVLVVESLAAQAMILRSEINFDSNAIDLEP
jgi:hypothetical protein